MSACRAALDRFAAPFIDMALWFPRRRRVDYVSWLALAAAIALTEFAVRTDWPRRLLTRRT